MDTSYEDDTVIIASSSEPLIETQNTRRLRIERWTVHLILGSIAFETAAFYSFEDNISGVLQSNMTFNRTSDQTTTINNIFEGNPFKYCII